MDEEEKRKYHLGYLYTIKNAKAHYKAATYLSKYVNYGIAYSHLVLATEEAIKALWLYERSQGFAGNEDEFKLFFSHHLYKQDYLKDSLIRLDPMDILGQIFKNAWRRNLNKQEELKQCEDTVKGEVKPTREEERRKTVLEWLKDANYKKNYGFYVGFDEKSKFWTSPRYIGKKEFDHAKRITRKIITFYIVNGGYSSTLWGEIFSGFQLRYRK